MNKKKQVTQLKFIQRFTQFEKTSGSEFLRVET